MLGWPGNGPACLYRGPARAEGMAGSLSPLGEPQPYISVSISYARHSAS